jgi:hypothetical protein
MPCAGREQLDVRALEASEAVGGLAGSAGWAGAGRWAGAWGVGRLRELSRSAWFSRRALLSFKANILQNTFSGFKTNRKNANEVPLNSLWKIL